MTLRRLLFLTIFVWTIQSSATAEIIENKKILNKSFDVWNVSCEDDEMLGEIACRLFVEISEGTTLFVNPNSSENKILLVSSDAYYGRKIFVRVDNNKLISSQIFVTNKHNIVNFEANDLKTLYSQIKTGKDFYIRFTIRDILSPNGFREITAKLSFAEFSKALAHYNVQMSKYNFTINNVN
jgi:hypothetical protein